jgi:ABC-type bacteriocin/lantibiotic exporter with double-glycine peptidase domain
VKTFKRIIDLLTPQESRRLFFILIMVLIMGLIDIFGIISILPFIAVLSKPELVETNTILVFAFEVSKNFGVNTVNQFLFILALFSFLMLVFSSSFKALTVYAQHRFAAMREYSLGRRLLEGYLRQPYVWFLNKNGGELGKNILSEVNRFTNYCLSPMINLISNSIIVIALISLIIFIDPIVALISFVVLSGSYIIIYKSVSLVIKKIGNKNIKSNEVRFKALQELFEAIKQLKVRGLEQTYIDRYSLSAQTYANTLALSQIIAQLPRFFIEIIAFGGIIILVLVLLKINNEITEVLPIIVIYVFAGYKLIPALQLIYHAYSNLKFSNPVLKALHKDIVSLKLEKPENNKLSLISLKQNIELKNIYFTYPNNIRPTLNNITMTIPAKSIVGLVGSTGSGKTTLVDIITGLLESQKGTLMVNGKDIFKDNIRSWQKIIGYVPQNIYLSDDTVSANIAFGVEPENIDYAKVCKSAITANIHDFIINELSESYNTIVGERGVRLSGGQRQRLGIARAIYHEPELLIFDEATNALDGITENVVMEAVKKLGKNNTIIIIAHRLTTVRDCDNIFLLENGELVDEGTFEKLSKTNKNFSSMLSVQ